MFFYFLYESSASSYKNFQRNYVLRRKLIAIKKQLKISMVIIIRRNGLHMINSKVQKYSVTRMFMIEFYDFGYILYGCRIVLTGC